MEDEERRRKLQAGKEKLAAFKKRAKRKKKRVQGPDGREYDVTASDASSYSDFSGFTSESDQDYLSGNEAEKDGKHFQPGALERVQHELEKKSQKIRELEETVYGKQAALDSVIAENDDLRSRLESASENGLSGTSSIRTPTPDTDTHSLDSISIDEVKLKVEDLSFAVSQRDEALHRLSQSLEEAQDGREKLQIEYDQQAEQLAEQVALLESQLLDANATLNALSAGPAFPMQALVEAKNELVALQKASHQKDGQLMALQGAIKQRDQSLDQLTHRFTQSTADYANIHEELRNTKAKLESAQERHQRLEKESAKLRENYAEQARQLAVLRKDQDAEIRAESFRLFEELRAENQTLREKERQSGDVISQLMADVEHLKKSSALSSPNSSILSSSDLMTVESHEKQLDLLRAELDEMYGEQISQIKETMGDKYLSQIEKLSKEVKKSGEEKERLSQQVTLWQQQYVVLSQNNVSSTDLVAQISELTSENLGYKQQLTDLREQSKDQPKKSKRGVAGAELEATKQKLLQLETIVNEAQKYKEIVADMEKRLEDADEQKRKYLQDIDAQNAQIEKLKAALQDSVEEKQSYKNRLEEKDKEMKATVLAHKDELEVVLVQFQQKAKLDGVEWQQELEKERAEMERLKQENEMMKKATAQNIPQHEMKMLMELQKEQVDSMRSDYEKKLQERDVLHGQKVEEMIQEHAKEITVLRVQLSQDMTAVVAEEKQRLVDEMNASFAQTMAQSNKEHEDRLLHVQTQLETLKLETAAEAEPAGVDVMDLTAKLSQTSMERDSALKSVQDLYTDRVEQKQTLDLMQAEKEALELRILHLAKEYEAIKTEKDELKPQVEALRSENAALQERLQETSSECEQLQRSIVEEKEGVTDLRGEMDGLKEQIGQLTKERQVIETQVEQWTEQSPSSGSPDLVDRLRAQFEQVKLRYAQEMEHSRQEQMSALSRLDEALLEKQNMTAQFTKDMSDYRLAYDALRMQYEQMMQAKQASGDPTDAQELVSCAEIAQLRSGYAAVYAEMNRLRDALVTMQAAQASKDSSVASEESQTKDAETLTDSRQPHVENCSQETQTVSAASSEAITEMPAEEIDSQETQTEDALLTTEQTQTKSVVAVSVDTMTEVVASTDATTDMQAEPNEAALFTEQQQTQTPCVPATSVDTMTDESRLNVQICPQETQTVGVASADATTEIQHVEGSTQETQTATEEVTATEQQYTQTQAVVAASVDTMTDEPRSDVENYPQETQTVQAETEQQQTQTQSVAASTVDTMTDDPHSQTHSQHTQTDFMDVRDSPDRGTDFTVSSDAAEGAGESSDEEVAPSLTHDSSPEFEDVDAVPVIREYADDIGEERLRQHSGDGHMHAELQAAADHIQELLCQRNDLKLNHEAEIHELMKKMEGYEVALEALKQQHALELEAAKEDLEHSMQNLERVIQEREDLKVSAAKHVEQLSEQHSAELKGMAYQLDEVEGDHGCELGSYKVQLNELREKVERLSEEKRGLEEEYEAEMHAVIEQHDVRVRAIRDSYEQEIEKLRSELTDMTNRIAEQQEELMSQYEGHIQTLKHECEDVDSQLQQVMSEKKTLQKEIMGSDTQSETVKDLVAQIQELNTIRETAEQDAKNAQRKLKDSNSDYDELCEDNKRLRETIRTLKSEKNELYHQVEDLMSSRANFEECLIAIQAQEELSYAKKPSVEAPGEAETAAPLRDDVIAPETAPSTSQAPIVDSDLEIAQRTIAQLEAAKAKLMEELNEVRREYEVLEADKEAIRSGLETVRSKLKELHSKEERHREEVERLSEENDELSSDALLYKEQNDRLKAEDAELRAEFDQLKNECEELRKQDSEDSADDSVDDLRRERDEAVRRSEEVIRSSDEALALLEEAKAQYLDEISDLNEEVESARQETAAAEVARDSYKEVLNTLQGEVAMFHQQFTGSETPELSEGYSALIFEMQKKLEELKMRLDEAESTAAQREVQCDETNYLLGELKQQIADHQRQREEEMLKVERDLGASGEALREAEAEKKEVQDLLSAKCSQAETLQAELKSLSDDLDELKETLSSAESKNAELAEIIKFENDSHESEVAALKEKIQSLNHQISSLEDLNNSIQDLEHGKLNMEGALAEKAAQIAALNSQLSSAAEEAERRNAKIAELEKNEEELNNVVHGLQNYRTSQQQAFDAKCSEVDMLLAEKVELQAAKTDTEEEMCILREKCDDLLAQKESFCEEVSTLKDGCDDLMKQKMALEEEMAQKTAQEKSFRAEQEQVRDLLKTLEQALADSDAEMSRLQTEREALLEEKLKTEELCEALQSSLSALDDQRMALEGDLSKRSTQLRDMEALLEEAKVQYEDNLRANIEDLERQNSSHVDKMLSDMNLLRDENTQLLNEINALKTQISVDASETLSRLVEANTNAVEMRKEVEMLCADNKLLRDRSRDLEEQSKAAAEAEAEKDEEVAKLREEIVLLQQELEQADSVFVDDGHNDQQVSNLESQLLMLTKENDLLQEEIKQLKEVNAEVKSPVTDELFVLQEENTELKVLKEEQEKLVKKLRADLSVAACADMAAYEQQIAQLNEEKKELVAMYEEASLNSDVKKQKYMQETQLLKSDLSESGFAAPSMDERLAEMEEQHKVEMDVLKYSLTERYEVEKARLKMEILLDLREEYDAKKEDLVVEFEQKEKAMKAASERDFIEELRKVKQQMQNENSDRVEQLRLKYETDVLHQICEGDDEMKLHNVIQSMQKDIAMLTSGRDSLLHDLDSSKQRQEELEEEVVNLERQVTALQADNRELNQEMEKNNLYASKDSAAEHSPDDWRITLDKLQSENLTLKERLEGQKQAVEETEGLRPEKDEDLQASLMALQLENQALKVQVEDRSLSVAGDVQEEMMKLQTYKTKYEELMQKHAATDSMQEGFIDLKVQYEALVNENNAIKSRLDSSTVSSSTSEDVEKLVQEKEGLAADLEKVKEKARKEATKLKAKALVASKKADELQVKLDQTASSDEVMNLRAVVALLTEENESLRAEQQESNEEETKLVEVAKDSKGLKQTVLSYRLRSSDHSRPGTPSSFGGFLMPSGYRKPSRSQSVDCLEMSKDAAITNNNNASEDQYEELVKEVEILREEKQHFLMRMQEMETEFQRLSEENGWPQAELQKTIGELQDKVDALTEEKQLLLEMSKGKKMQAEPAVSGDATLPLVNNPSVHTNNSVILAHADGRDSLLAVEVHGVNAVCARGQQGSEVTREEALRDLRVMCTEYVELNNQNEQLVKRNAQLNEMLKTSEQKKTNDDGKAKKIKKPEVKKPAEKSKSVKESPVGRGSSASRRPTSPSLSHRGSMTKHNSSKGSTLKPTSSMQDLKKLAKENEKLHEHNKDLVKKLDVALNQASKDFMSLGERYDQSGRSSPAAVKSKVKSTPGESKSSLSEVNALKKDLEDIRKEFQKKCMENVNLLQMIKEGVDPEDILHLRMQQEILLAEKAELCAKFEDERSQLMEDNHELLERNEQLQNQLSVSSGGPPPPPPPPPPLDEVPQSSDNVRYEAVKRENRDLEVQLKMLLEEKKQVCAHLQADCMAAQQESKELKVEVSRLKEEYSDLLTQHQLLGVEPELAASVVSDVSVGGSAFSGETCVLPDRRSPMGACLPASELSVQYEILMQEKKTVCLQLEQQQEKCQALKEQIREMGRAMEEGDENVNDLTAQRQLTQVQNKILTEEKNDICKKLNSLAKKYETEKWNTKQKIKELDAVKVDCEELKTNITELLLEKEKLEQDLSILTLEKKSAEAALSSCQLDNKNLMDLLNGTRDEMRQVKDAKVELQFRLDESLMNQKAVQKEASSQAEAYQAEKDALKTQMNAMNEERDEMKQSLEEKDRLITELESTAADKERTLALELEKLNKEIGFMNQLNKDLQGSLEDCWGGKGVLSEDLAQLREEFDAYKKEKEREIQELQEEKEDTRQNDVMQALQSSDLDGEDSAEKIIAMSRAKDALKKHCASLEADSLEKDEDIRKLRENQNCLEKSLADFEEKSLAVKEALMKVGIDIRGDEEVVEVVLREFSSKVDELAAAKSDLCAEVQKNKHLEKSLSLLKESLIKGGVVIGDDEDLDEKLLHMNEENVSLKEKCAEWKTEAQKKSEENLDLVKQHSHLQGRCSVLDQEKDRLAELVATLQKEKIVLEMQLGQDGNLIKQLKKECKSLKDKVKQGEDERERAKIDSEDEMKKLRKEKEKMEIKVREVDDAVKKLVQDLKQKEDGVGIVEKVREERDRLIEKVKAGEAEREALKDVEAKNEECAKRIAEEEIRRRTLQEALEDNLREVKVLAEANEELLSTKRLNEDTIEGLNKKVAQLESKCFEMDCHLQEAQKEISAYKPLEAKLANVEEELHAVNENIMKNLVAGEKDSVILQLQQEKLSWKGKADQFLMECEALKTEMEACSKNSERIFQDEEKLRAEVVDTEQKLMQSQAQCQSLMLEKSKILEECLAIEKGSSTVKDLCMDMEKSKSKVLADLVAAQNAIGVFEEKIEALKSEKQTLAEEVHRLNLVLREKEAALACVVMDHEKVLSQKIKEVQDLQEECRVKDEEIEALQFDDAKEENEEEMKVRMDEAELRLAKLKQENEVLAEQKEVDAKQLNQINQLYNIVNSQLNDFEVECSELKSDNSELKREANELNERLQCAERAKILEVEELRAQNERLMEDLDDQRKEMEKVEGKVESLLEEVNRKETECVDALAEVDQLKKRLAEMQAQGIASDNDIKEVEKELEQMKEEVRRLRSALKECEENSASESDRLWKEKKEFEERVEILQNNLAEADARNVQTSSEFEVLKKSAAENKKSSDAELEKAKEEKEDLLRNVIEKNKTMREMEEQICSLSVGAEALVTAQNEAAALKESKTASEHREAGLLKKMKLMEESLCESEEKVMKIAKEKVEVSREKDEAIAELKGKQIFLIDMQSELMQVKERIIEVLLEKDKYLEEKNQMSRNITEREHDVSRLESDVERIQKTLQNKEQEIAVLKEEMLRLEEDRVALTREMEASSQSYSNCLQDKERAEGSVRELQEAYGKIKKNAEEMEEQVSTQKEALQDLKDTASRAEVDYNRLKEMYEELRAERSAAQEEAIVPVALENLTSTPKVECVHTTEDAAREEVEELLKAKRELEKTLSHAEEDKRNMVDTILQLKEELSEEKDRQQRKMNDFQKLLDTVTAAKEKIEQEMHRQRLEHEQRLTAVRNSATADSSAETQNLLRQINGAEKTISDVRDKLRVKEEEKDLLKLRISHLTRECQLQESHVHDLEKQVVSQQEQLQEAMHEHKQSIRLLAELRFEAEQGRQEQKGDFIRLEGELHKLESHLGGEEERKAYELKHSEMVDELNALRQQSREMHDEKNRLTWENQLLKQTMDREQRSYHLRPSHRSMSVANVNAEALGWSSLHEISAAPGAMSKCSSMASVCSIASVASVDSQVPAFDFTKDLIDAKKKIRHLEQRQREMLEEREALMQQLRKQEALVIELRKAAADKQKKSKKFSFGSLSSSTQSANIATDVGSQQIGLLQRQRDDLMARLAGLEEKNRMVSQLEQNLSDVEAKLKIEREQLRLKNQDKEKVELDLLKERLAVEKYARDYQQLKKQLHQKEFIETQLQADASAADASTLQKKLCEVNSDIRKAVLQKAIGIQVGESMLPWKPSPKLRKMRQVGTQVKERMLRLDCGCSTDSTMRMNVECRYHKAVDKLRRELKRDAASREKRQFEGSQTF